MNCPSCEGKTLKIERNGDWKCMSSKKVPGQLLRVEMKEGQIVPIYEMITVRDCAARGVTIDGELLYTAKPRRNDV